MDFRKRLFVIFMIMTLFPILLLASLGFVIIKYQTNAMKATYKTEVDALQVLQNPVQVLNNLTRETYTDLKKVTKETPDYLLDEEYLSVTNRKLQNRQAFLLVQKGRGVTYCGDEPFFQKIRESLPEYEIGRAHV